MIAENLHAIHNRICQAEKQYGRTQHAVSLLAVSKAQSCEKIQEAVDAGQTAFGENYCQEALEKIRTLNNPVLSWHFVGRIQSNKARMIAKHFDWVHSVDSEKLAKHLNEYRVDTQPPLNLCLQINVSHEPQKGGIALDALPILAETIAALPRLRLRGLMAIPAPTTDFEKQCAAFRTCRLAQEALIARGLTLDTLSMGMSRDFEAAIKEGATLIRIGTGIFGPRKT